MSKKILIIDDNDHLAIFLEDKLTAAGYEVVTSFDGLSAIKALAEYTPDVVFCDYFLPNINGDQLCRIIRRMDHLKNVYLVIMTAAAAELDLDPLNLGANALIAKGSFQDTEKHIFAILEDEDVFRPDRQEQEIKKGLDSVTPRQITRERIAKNNFLQTMLDSMTEGIIEVYCNQVAYVNAAAAKILGKSQDQLLTVPLPGLFDEEAFFQVESLSAFASAEIPIRERPEAKQPANRILSIKKLPYDDDSETFILLIADITEQKNSDKILRDSHHHLQSLVEERTADLKRTNEMLQQAQKLEAIGTLSGGIAHDFNNILGSMIGYMELTKLENRPEKTKYYIEKALNVSNRAKDIINQILIFSRHQKQERKPVLLAPLIKEAIKLIRSTLPSTIQINQQITGQPTRILADPTQMHQILMNFCTNSFYAMRETGGILDIQLSHEEIQSGDRPHPLYLAPGRYAKLTVKDTGHGIDPAIIDRIFDPFFTTKGPGEGTGLGLSVVYGIIRDHDGKIDVSSEPGKGTTISVFLPLIETTEPDQDHSPENIPRGNERILLVDDEPDVIEVVKNMLTSLGDTVTERRSSKEALELFRALPHSFDLVITDMTMPIIRGDVLAKELLKINADIPIILCSGYNELISEDKARDIGIRQFIMKPLYMIDLARVIRKVLD